VHRLESALPLGVCAATAGYFLPSRRLAWGASLEIGTDPLEFSRSFFDLPAAKLAVLGNLRLTSSFVPVLKTRTFRLQTGTKPVQCSLIARSRGLD
jgi:hypothetical protein